MKRDLIWSILWQLRDFDDGWHNSTVVSDRWRNGRDRSGLAYSGDYIPRERITAALKQAVDEGRAERRKRAGRHPEYRAIEPSYV